MEKERKKEIVLVKHTYSLTQISFFIACLTENNIILIIWKKCHFLVLLTLNCNLIRWDILIIIICFCLYLSKGETFQLNLTNTLYIGSEAAPQKSCFLKNGWNRFFWVVVFQTGMCGGSCYKTWQLVQYLPNSLNYLHKFSESIDCHIVC